MKLKEKCIIKTCDGVELIVRSLVKADAVALQLFNDSLSPDSCSRFKPHSFDNITVSKVLARAEKGDDYVLGAFDNDRLVAYFFLWYIRKRVPLLGIGILDEFQGRGLGRQIMQLLITHAEETQRDGIELTTMPDNKSAFALYQKLGFKHYGDVENIAGDGTTVVEHAMYYTIKPDSKPMEGQHKPPV